MAEPDLEELNVKVTGRSFLVCKDKYIAYPWLLHQFKCQNHTLSLRMLEKLGRKSRRGSYFVPIPADIKIKQWLKTPVDPDAPPPAEGSTASASDIVSDIVMPHDNVNLDHTFPDQSVPASFFPWQVRSTAFVAGMEDSGTQTIKQLIPMHEQEGTIVCPVGMANAKVNKIIHATTGCLVVLPVESVTVNTESPGGLLASDVGTGKTAIMLHASVSSFRDGPTLIVVPNSLEAQWLCELKRMYGAAVHDDPTTFVPIPPQGDVEAPVINLWRCNTLAAFAKISGAKAPWTIVLTTYDFVAARVKELRGALNEVDWKAFVQDAPAYCVANNMSCCFADVQWHRIVYDEVMDGIAKHGKQVWSFLNALKTRHVWAMSATPDKYDVLVDILRLRVVAAKGPARVCDPDSLTAPKEPKDVLPVMTDLGMDINFSLVMSRTFRVTKAETKKYVQPTRVESQVVHLQLTPEERRIMNYIKMQSTQGHNNALICTDVASFLNDLIKKSENDGKVTVCTVDMFWERMKHQNSEQGTTLQSDLQKKKERIQELRSILDALPNAAAERGQVSTELRKLEREYAAIEAKLSKVAINQTFLDGLNERMEDAKTNPCPICVDDIGDDRMAITPCGHVFCIDCVTSWLAVNASCPACRRSPVTLSQITVVSSQVQAIVQEPVKVEHSTKLDFLLTHLRNVFQTTQDKVIVFCNYPSTLKKLFDILESEGIQCARMTGNVHGKGAAMIKFKYGKVPVGSNNTASLDQCPTHNVGLVHSLCECRVMLLNTTSQASGLDLIEANRIVFVDSDLSADTLTQAKGRCCRLGQTKGVMLTFLTVPEFENLDVITEFVNSLNRVNGNAVNANVSTTTVVGA